MEYLNELLDTIRAQVTSHIEDEQPGCELSEQDIIDLVKNCPALN